MSIRHRSQCFNQAERGKPIPATPGGGSVDRVIEQTVGALKASGVGREQRRSGIDVPGAREDG